MTVFNRIFVAIVCLVLIAAAVAVIVLAWTSPGSSIDGLRDAADWLDDNNQDLEKGILTAVAAIIGVIALVVFVLELIPPRSTEVSVTDLKVGNAVLSTAAIAQRVEEAVSRVPHVADARAVVKPKRKGVLVNMDLHVDPEANLAAVTDEVYETAADVLNNRVHVAMAEPPRARVFYREIRLRRGGARPEIMSPQRGQEAADRGATQEDSSAWRGPGRPGSTELREEPSAEEQPPEQRRGEAPRAEERSPEPQPASARTEEPSSQPQPAPTGSPPSSSSSSASGDARTEGRPADRASDERREEPASTGASTAAAEPSPAGERREPPRQEDR
jgi:hypothetical protein